MNKGFFLAPAVFVAAASATAATAQSTFIPSVIAQTIMNMQNQGVPERCLDGLWEPTPQQAARFTAEAEPSLRAYLALAGLYADPTSSFTDRRSDRYWSLDGVESEIAAIHDPWASRVVRLELVGLRLGGMKVRGRAIFRAFAADGTELGIYDGLFRRRTRGFAVSSLSLYSPGAAKQPAAISGFCYTPGDTEEFREARARNEAERAERRAAREAEREARRASR